MYEVTKRKHGRGHVYEIDGEKVERVTQIIKTILAKGGGFERWLQLDAVERFQRLIIENEKADWTTQTPSDILKWSKGGARDPLARGTAVHKAAETQDFEIAKYHPADQGYVTAVARFFQEEQPIIHEQELVVGSKELGYAGTLDAHGELGNHMVLLDWKTANKAGTKPYAEYHLQLSAYELASVEMGYEPTDRQLIVMLYPDGEYAKFTARATPDHWRAAMAWYGQLAAVQEAIAA